MRKIIFLVMITCSGSVMAQNPELIKVWASRTSSDERKSPGTAFEKAQLLKKGLEKKKKSFSLIDEFPYWAMAFEASTAKAKPSNEKEVILKLRQFETITFSMSSQLDTLYPGILSWYQKYDHNLVLFRFKTEPDKPISLSDMIDDQKAVEPNDAVAAIRFHVINIQRELFHSQNLVISKDYERVIQIYQSLEDSMKSLVEKQGYPEFWKEQQACFMHKADNKSWACECGFKNVPIFTSETACSTKQILLNKAVALQDPKTALLVRLINGDLSATGDAVRTMLSTWGNVQNSIPSEIIFWWCVELGITKPSDQMKINFRKLWSEGRNDYNLAIGLDSATVANLEDYFVCRLGIKSVSITETTIRPAMVEEMNQAPVQKMVSKDTHTQAITSSKKNTPQPLPNTSVKTQPSMKEIKSISEKILPRYDIVKLREVIDANVQQELENREGLHACAETKVINDSTLELELHGCGDGKGTFAVMQVETPLAGDFFNYCSNVLADQLESFKDQLGGSYHVTVIGTADKLSYSKNQYLADQRAEFVKKNMGKKVLQGVGGIENISTEGLTDQEERKVILRVVLSNPKTQ